MPVMHQGVFDAFANALTSAYGQIAAGIGVGVGIWKLFAQADNVLSAKAKEDIGLWLLANEDRADNFQTTARRWPDTFATIFWQVFGSKHLSWYCFLHSCEVSIGGVVLMFTLWSLIYPTQVVAYFRLN